MAQTGPVGRRVRALLDGTGWFFGLAAVLFIFTLLVVLMELQSPDALLWTGQGATGTEQGGIVYFRWHGQSYTANAPGYGSAKAVSVYFDPANPTNAMVDNAFNRVTIFLLAGVPLTGGVALTVAGLTLGYRRRRRTTSSRLSGAGYGQGLDSDVLAQYLADRRRGPGEVPYRDGSSGTA